MQQQLMMVDTAAKRIDMDGVAVYVQPVQGLDDSMPGRAGVGCRGVSADRSSITPYGESRCERVTYGWEARRAEGPPSTAALGG